MGFAQEQVETLSRALDEPSWLTERRLEAWGYYEKLELPREKDEPWRYTDLRRLGFDLGDFAPTEPNPYDAGLALGRDPELEERGVVLLPLYNAIQTRPELVQRHRQLLDVAFAESHPRPSSMGAPKGGRPVGSVGSRKLKNLAASRPSPPSGARSAG